MYSKDKTKTLCYVVATTDGRMPCRPMKTNSDIQKQIAFCKQFNQAEAWRGFEIARDFRYEGFREIKGKPYVVNVPPEVSDRIILLIQERFNGLYLG